jgi:hypothetical protein
MCMSGDQGVLCTADCCTWFTQADLLLITYIYYLFPVCSAVIDRDGARVSGRLAYAADLA